MDKPATPYGADHPTAPSPPVPREEVHNRRVSCNGFVREDGLFDIEAEMTDNKSYAFPTEFRGDVTPDQYVHHMKVHAAEALTIAGPYAICPTANDVFPELMGVIGTIAFQTRYGEEAQQRRQKVAATGMETAAARSEARTSVLVNSRVAYAVDD